MKCYLDSFTGLVPCIAIAQRGVAHREVQVKVTATRGAYKRGDVVWSGARYVIPRGQVFVKRGTFGQYRIRAFNADVFDHLPIEWQHYFVSRHTWMPSA